MLTQLGCLSKWRPTELYNRSTSEGERGMECVRRESGIRENKAGSQRNEWDKHPVGPFLLAEGYTPWSPEGSLYTPKGLKHMRQGPPHTCMYICMIGRGYVLQHRFLGVETSQHMIHLKAVFSEISIWIHQTFRFHISICWMFWQRGLFIFHSWPGLQNISKHGEMDF